MHVEREHPDVNAWIVLIVLTHRRISAVITAQHGDAQFVKNLMRFRKCLFVDQLSWALENDGEFESDEFDVPETLYAGLTIDGEIVAGFRACRTDGPYLAADVFPQLAVERPYPKRADAWEISRFGVAPWLDPQDRFRIARINYAVMIRFAQVRQAVSLVALTDRVYERFLARLGIRTERYGPPQIAARDARGRPLELLAGEIPLDESNRLEFRRLLFNLKDVDLTDETPFFGPSAVSA